jgi:lysyl-tRNA synthetase, class I
VLGQEQGPRIGSFFALYGLDESIALLRHALDPASAKPSDSLAV